MSNRPPLRRHCCVFFCLEPTGRSLKSSLSCATNILAATVGQQQDVFPERKRGWEVGPNVDLFLLLSFLFRLSRSCRCACRKLYFSQLFKVSHFSFFRVGFLWPYRATILDTLFFFLLHLASIPPLIAGPLKIWGISCCLTLINGPHLYQLKQGGGGWVHK